MYGHICVLCLSGLASLLAFLPFSYRFVQLSNGNALEELSVRAEVSLGQKRVFHDIALDGQEDDDEDFEKEYTALSAQVVRYSWLGL
jgi:hypothetical protein